MRRAIIAVTVFGIALLSFAAGDRSNEKKNRVKQSVNFQVEGAGICQVDGGGKRWLLIDVTDELKPMDYGYTDVQDIETSDEKDSQ